MGCLLALHALFHLARLCGVGDHADRVVVADVLPEPVEQHHHLVLHAEDRTQVDDEPQHPGEEALTAELANLYDRLVASDGSHRAEVLIVERGELAAVCALVDELEVLGEVLSLLYSHLRHLRMSVRVGSVGGLQTLVADGEHVVESRYAVVFVNLEAEAASHVALVDAGHGVGSDARHPEERTCRNLGAVLHDYLVVAIVGHHLAELYVYAHALEKLVRLLRRLLRETGKQAVARLDEVYVHQRRVHVGVVVRYDVASHLCKRAGNLYARCAAAHDDDVEQFLAFLLSGAGESALEVGEQGVAQAHRLGHRLHRYGPLLDVLVAEEVGRSAGCQHEIVVVDFADGGLQNLLLGVYHTSLSHAEIEVLALAEYLSEGERDAARVDTCRRYLIDKRRKLVEVVLVDQHYLHARPVEVFCKAQSAESATNDYYSFLLISLNIDAHIAYKNRFV